MIHIQYMSCFTNAEIIYLENVWRCSINESVNAYCKRCAALLSSNAGLPFDIWLRVYSFVNQPVPMVQGICSASPKDEAGTAMYACDVLHDSRL